MDIISQLHRQLASTTISSSDEAEIKFFIDNQIKARLEGSNPRYTVPSQTEVEHVVDYLVNRAAKSRKLKLKKASYEQMVQKAEEWIERLKKKADGVVETEQDVEVVKTWKSGMRLVKLVGENAYKREGKLMSHCLDGDTEVITSQGVYPIKDLVNKEVEVLTRGESGFGKFVKAPIKQYGSAELYRVTMTNGKGTEIHVDTTDKHRWYGYITRNKQCRELKELTTFSLEPGYEIPIVRNKRPLLISESKKGITLSTVGIMHGLTFGDGTVSEGRYARCDLYGDKASLLKYFSKESRTKEITRSVGGISVEDLPTYYKSVPDINENASYLYGFLAGYFAADGHLSSSGNPSITSADYNNLLKVEGICHRLGLNVIGINEEVRDGYKRGSIYKLALSVGALPASFYLLDKHAVNYKSAQQVPKTYTVKSIEALNVTKEVYCAEVKDTQCFVLRGNILTGNCVSSYFDSSSASIYSLRDAKNEPHCTMEITKDGDYVQQIKGKGNGSIHPKYIEYVIDTLKHFGIEVRGSELSNLGYIQLSEQLWKVFNYGYEGVRYLTFGGTNYFYSNSVLNKVESDEALVKYTKKVYGVSK